MPIGDLNLSAMEGLILNPSQVVSVNTSGEVGEPTTTFSYRAGVNPSTDTTTPSWEIRLVDDADYAAVIRTVIPGTSDIEVEYLDETDWTIITVTYVGPPTENPAVNGNTVATTHYRVISYGEDGLIVRRMTPLTDVSAPGGVPAFQDNGAGIGIYLRTDPDTPLIKANDPPVVHTSDGTVYPFGIVVCFAEGTLIATPEGARAVETLTEGELVVTASGAARPVKWIGSMTSRPSRHPRRNEVNPVRIRAGAFGDGLPVRDLRVSPGHAVFVDGVLIPAGKLVNGATIVQEEVERIRYYHVELESHDVLLAEGLPCESYLDDGNRRSFANAGESVELHGRLDPKSWDDACAPMVAAGPQLTAVQHKLHERAVELGWVKSEEANLRIVADGAEIVPLAAKGDRFWFQVPAATELKLVSSSGVLAQVMPGLEDFRRLGVAVAELRIDGAMLDLDSDAFGTGFHPIEQHGDAAWRWSDGEAALARAFTTPAMVEVAIHMVAPSWTRAAGGLGLLAA